jgi:DNA polymerase-3 subunit delta
MAPRLFDRICALTGFDLRIFTRNIEKLIDYIGPRNEISEQDIQAVLQRTKQDPIFELSNALAERNQIQALFYLDSLLAAGFHPLQLLAALANQLRKLLVAKDFCNSEPGRVWSQGMSYTQFKQDVIPVLQTFDEQVDLQVKAWNRNQAFAQTKEASDLKLVANPNNAYPVFQTLVKSAHYSQDELQQGLQRLNQTDLSLKTSVQDPVLALKKVIGDICAGRRDN